MEAIKPASRPHEFDSATIGALAHLYRGEIYRSTIWRTRLELVQRASLGPIPGEVVLLGGVLFSGGWIAFAMMTFFLDRAKHGARPSRVAMG